MTTIAKLKQESHAIEKKLNKRRNKQCQSRIDKPSIRKSSDTCSNNTDDKENKYRHYIVSTSSFNNDQEALFQPILVSHGNANHSHSKSINQYTNDRARIRKRLEQRWEELKNDVDKTFKNFQKNKSKHNNSNNAHVHSKTNQKLDQTYKTNNEIEMNDDFSQMSVRELKKQLLKSNIPIHQCIEKQELVSKLEQAFQNKKDSHQRKSEISHFSKPTLVDCSTIKNQVNISSKEEKTPENGNNTSDSKQDQERIKNNVDQWVAKWSYHRSLRQLLNSILGLKPHDSNYLKRGCHHQEIVKSYRKALLRVHPDKHVNATFQTRYKACEMFKIISELYQKFQKKI